MKYSDFRLSKKDEKKYVVIIGCGRLGASLAAEIYGQGNDVCIADRDRDAFRKLDSSMQGQALLFALEFFLFCVLGVTAVSLIVYAAYAVGFSFNKHKSALTAVSVLVFFQLVQFAAIAVLANLFCDGFTAWSSLTGVQAGNAIFAVALVCELIVCVIFYLVTYFFLTRKLNLE